MEGIITNIETSLNGNLILTELPLTGELILENEQLTCSFSLLNINT